MLETIYIARHGFRNTHEFSLRAPGPTSTPKDPPLTAYGVKQSRQLAQYLNSLPQNRIQAIFSSPYYRCLQTADPIAELLDLPIFVEPGLSEWYMPVRKHTGLHPRPPEASSLQTHFSRISPTHRPLVYPSRDGETITELHDRVSKCLELLQEALRGTDIKHVLLVTHAATNIALGRTITNNPDLKVGTGCCSLGKYRREGDQWVCQLNGDASFLEGGVERDWSFEQIEEMEEDGIMDPQAFKPKL